MIKRQSLMQYAAMGLLLICAAANPLEQVFSAFKYIDELVCLLTFSGGMFLWLRDPDLRRRLPRHLLYFIPFFAYMFMQLLGSIIFRYQPLSAVVIDALTNAKFWLTLYGCYLLGGLVDAEAIDKGLLLATKAASVGLFLLAVIERFDIGFTGAKHTPLGIPYSQMIYSHPTYLAAAAILLLAVLMANWEKKLLPYVIMDLILLIFTFRAKAYGGAVAFVGLFVFTVLWKQKLRLWQIAAAGAAALILVWDKIDFYFIKLQGEGARAVMLKTSIQVMKDYFPLGTGFGTFASNQADVHYSPLYHKYGFTNGTVPYVTYDLSEKTRAYLNDHFWPIVFAQSGAIGTLAFIAILVLLIVCAWKIYESNYRQYAGALFCIAYLLIASTSEPAFNNTIAIPLAVLIGYWLAPLGQMKLYDTVIAVWLQKIKSGIEAACKYLTAKLQALTKQSS